MRDLGQAPTKLTCLMHSWPELINQAFKDHSRASIAPFASKFYFLSEAKFKFFTKNFCHFLKVWNINSRQSIENTNYFTFAIGLLGDSES